MPRLSRLSRPSGVRARLTPLQSGSGSSAFWAISTKNPAGCVAPASPQYTPCARVATSSAATTRVNACSSPSAERSSGGVYAITTCALCGALVRPSEATEF